jgi:hypothetical protein
MRVFSVKSVKHWLIRKGQNFADGLLGPKLQPIVDELRTANLQFPRDPTTPNPLLDCGRRYFSQNDEDGILLEILRRVGIVKPSIFLEFGVGDGTENNTIILLALRWRGVWVGGSALAFEVPQNSRLSFLRQWITSDNAATLATEALATLKLGLKDVRVASIDLDGNDAHIARALLTAGLAPDVFVLEYNAKFPPNIEFEMPYNSAHVWKGDDYFGVSLKSWTNILSPAGYILVACNANGCNAFFVKASYASRFADVPTEIEKLYRIGHYRRCATAGHPTSGRTVRRLIMTE